MSEYLCYRCGARVELNNVNTVIACPNCACKILIKAVPNVVKRVSCD